MSAGLPAGWSVRSVTAEDAELIAGLINASTRAEIGIPWTTEAETRDELTGPGRNAEGDDALVLDADGVACGYLQLWADIAPYTEIFALVYVHPRSWGNGVSTFLLRLGEERGRAKVDLAPHDERVVLRVAGFANNTDAAALFEALRFTYVRTFWMMQIDLRREPDLRDAPMGVTIRRFDAASDTQQVYEALAEAFADHWGHPFPSFEQWRHYSIEGSGSDFDAGLWFVAVDGDEIAGVICCSARSGRDANIAVVDELGVRRGWRQRGIGLTLLLTAFREIRLRGIGRAELGVDSESPTRATHLYERAGMHVAYSWEIWEKELRAAR
jgi:mycothiol synthase